VGAAALGARVADYRLVAARRRLPAGEFMGLGAAQAERASGGHQVDGGGSAGRDEVPAGRIGAWVRVALGAW
jgi:hypothetical protein